MAELEREYGLPHDTWGAYFGGLILREVSLAEAVGNALLGVLAQPLFGRGWLRHS
jgi:hypothetical protein